MNSFYAYAVAAIPAAWIGISANDTIFGLVYPEYQAVLPVVSRMELSEPVLSDGMFTGKVVGWKVRDCIRQPGSEIGFSISNGRWAIVSFTYLDDDTPYDSRPVRDDQQDFGYWRWDGVPDGASAVAMSITHDCGGRLVNTLIGPFPAT